MSPTTSDWRILPSVRKQRARGNLGAMAGCWWSSSRRSPTRYAHFGRKVVFMGEFPLEPGDIPALPSYLINTIVNGPKFDPLYKARGIRQMLHSSTQGEEDLFPNYFLLPDDRRLHKPERQEKPRVQDAFEMISTHSARTQADVLGVINAGWADAGLHPEAFWLGYAAITAAGWRPSTPGWRKSLRVSIEPFMDTAPGRWTVFISS